MPTKRHLARLAFFLRVIQRQGLEFWYYLVLLVWLASASTGLLLLFYLLLIAIFRGI